ncbi:MAG: WD40 repeat domain-containing protein [Candidatus Moraniibacteriota bacterium]
MVNLKIKKIFFWFLVILFALIAPVVVSYAMGYRFSLERGIFVYSGSITIKPTPREVEVFVDGEKVSTGMINFLNYSYHIGSLFPGKYMLEVRSPGYIPWAQEAYVHSGVSTEFWNVFLAREKYTQLEYPTQNVENFFISPDGKRIALAEEKDNKIWIKILDIKKEEIIYEFLFEGYGLSKNKKENIEWSPREGRLIVPLEKEGKKEYFVINIGTEEFYSLNKKIDKDDIKKARWSSDDRNTLFYMKEDVLFRSDLENTANEVEVAKNIVGYDLAGSNIYYLSGDNHIIYKKNISGRSEAIQVTTESINATGGDNFELIVYDENRIALVSQDKNLYLYNQGEESKGVKEIAQGVNGIHFSNDGKKLAFWTNNEIAVYFVRKWETQPGRKEGQKIDVVRFSQAIENVNWFDDYEHLIFSVGNQIKITELDNRSMKNIENLVDLVGEGTKATYSHREENLFFIDSKNENKKLYSISLTEEDE